MRWSKVISRSCDKTWQKQIKSGWLDRQKGTLSRRLCFVYVRVVGCWLGESMKPHSTFNFKNCRKSRAASRLQSLIEFLSGLNTFHRVLFLRHNYFLRIESWRVLIIPWFVWSWIQSIRRLNQAPRWNPSRKHWTASNSWYQILCRWSTNFY